MARPIRYDGVNGLIEMTDAQLDRLTYYLRVAFATQLATAGEGYIYSGSDNTNIGSATDTRSTQQTNSQRRNFSGGADYPSYPGIGSEIVSTYNYRQDRNIPPIPSNANLDASGYLRISSNNLKSLSTEADAYSEIISQCITDMRTGDEVGTYRVATSTPSNGGAGTWDDEGTWFIDRRYNNVGNTTYKYYLKRSLNNAPGSDIFPVGVVSSSDGNLKQRAIDANSDIIQNVLLPLLTRRLDDGDLNYSVSTSVSGITRGTFRNTRYNQSSNSQFFSNPVYYSRSTPNTSGSTTDVSTYYLRLT